MLSDKARTEMDAARGHSTRLHSTSSKSLAKAEARFGEAIRNALARVAPGKETKEGPGIARSLLPEHRERQPRTFPSVTPHDPRVVFAWPGAEPSDAQRVTLDALAARTVRLGHSSSFVSLRVREEQPKPNWVPAAPANAQASDDCNMRVVGPGQLAALCTTFERSEDVQGRVMPAVFQRYTRPSDDAASSVANSIFDPSWILLRHVRRDRTAPRFPSVRTVDIARGVRKALLWAHGPDAPEILSGHGSPGRPSLRPHLAYVPLPFVASEYADGRLLGVALILPGDASQEERDAVLRAVTNWERRALEKCGPEKDAYLEVHLGRAGVFSLLVDKDPLSSTLRSETWCGPARTWASATPVALHRNPGDLHARHPAKEAAAYAEAEAIIAQACEWIRLPTERVSVLPAAPLAGVDKARHFPSYMSGTPSHPRVLVHATITFKTAVRGPVLVGAGRHFGLGLFRPVK